MIWALAVVSLVAFALAFASHSPGWIGAWIFAGFVCGIVAALGFIDRHLRASSRPEHMTERELQALRFTLKTPGQQAPRQLPPSQDA